jgi:aldehyde dehydrogenase (NAD+)
MGPVVSEEQLDRVLGYVASAREDGATLLTGGERLGGELAAGCFLAPTVFGDVTADMRIAREEVFGPVIAVTEFAGEDELRHTANATIFGLAASVWTRDIGRALATVDAVRAGTVWVNCHNTLDPGSPFGGTKQSGYGRELGREVLDGYLETKSVWVDYGAAA